MLSRERFPDLSFLHLYLAPTVIFNLLAATNCEVLKFNGGSLGLFKYKVDGTEDCVDYEREVHDVAVEAARMGAVLSLLLSCSLVTIGVVKQYTNFPCSEFLIHSLGAAIQICTSLMYLTWKNELCTTFGCEWGAGASYIIVAQGLYLASSVAFACTISYRIKRPTLRSIDKRRRFWSNLNEIIKYQE
jgi:hypothetical protein